MATIPEALATAIQHHQSGRLQSAEQIYRQILQVDPNQADALHLLGLLAHGVGQHELALDYIGRAIGVKRDVPEFHNNLGQVYHALRRMTEAIASYDRALQLKPDLVGAHYNLGLAFKDQGRLADAVGCYLRALELRPDLAEAHRNLGLCLREQGKPDEAAACYRRALELKPDLADAHNHLGVALAHQGKIEAAIASLHRALELKPDLAEAHSNLGVALTARGRLDEAVSCIRRALELKPDLAEAHLNLGNALREQGQLDEAVACFHRALELQPDSAVALVDLANAFRDQRKLDEAVACIRRALELEPDFAAAHSYLGAAFMDQGKLEEALACGRRALELQPDFAGANHNLALTLLMLGRYEEGWARFESRIALFPPRDFAAPPWKGEPAEGRTIFVHYELWFGDTVQFIRYAPLLRERAKAARVIVECQPELARLLSQSLAGAVEIVAPESGTEATPPRCDWHLPLLSLPLALRIFEPLPMPAPYLRADPALRAIWRKRLGPPSALRVGLVWAGNRGHAVLRHRSIDAAAFRPLLRQPGVQFYSLVVQAAAQDVRALAGAGLIDLTTRINDFADTAAFMAELDLIISVDTAAAHLAGALGRPVWTLLQSVSDWRWGMEGERTPWYPTMRLFRQPERGDWDSVLRRMGEELEGWVRAGGRYHQESSA